MRFYAFTIFLLLNLHAKTQVIEGKVVDSIGNPIRGAVVSLIDSFSHKVCTYALTKPDGKFSLPTIKLDSNIVYILTIRHIGNKEMRRIVDFRNYTQQTIILYPDTKDLQEIIVRYNIPIQIRGDTSLFQADKFLSVEDRKLKDLFSNMPGFTVDENGRLSYKGNLVEKLFIDGDDPAGFNYGLITKNASVDFVDKIEVIEHFDDNRLMRDVRKTNHVAVNIISKEKYRMRLSGTADFGTSFGKKKLADLTTTILGNKVKQLNFANSNNIGKNLDENFDGSIYKSSEDRILEMHGTEDEKYNSVSTSNIFVPTVDRRLTLHNNDFGIAAIMSSQLGKSTKVNGQFGIKKTNQWIKKNTLSAINLGGNDFWTVKSNEIQQVENLKYFSTFSFKKDDGGKKTSSGYLFIKQGISDAVYNNVLRGSVNDSLTEDLAEKSWLYNANWTHTKLIRDKVIRFIINSERQDAQQDYFVQTLRLVNYFKLDSNFMLYQQKSNRILHSHSFDVKINEKIKAQNIEFGWSVNYLQSHSTFDQVTVNRNHMDSVPLHKGRLATNLISSFFYGKTAFKLTRKTSVSVLSNMGIGSLSIQGKRNVLPEFLSSLLWTKEISKKVDISLGSDWNRSFTNWYNFTPLRMLAGDVRIMNGIDFSGPSEKFSVNAGLQSLNFIKSNSFFFNLSYIHNRFIYGSSSIRQPEYSIIGYERYSNYNSLMLVASHSLFMRFMKSKLKFNLSIIDNKGGIRINHQFAQQRSMSIFFKGELNTGFDFPINGNLEGNILYSAYDWNATGKVENIQYAWSSKIQYTINKRMYMAGRWKYYQLALKKGFSSVDYYALWNINKSIDLTLEAINILNIETFNERLADAVSVNSSSFLLNKRLLLFTLSCSF